MTTNTNTTITVSDNAVNTTYQELTGTTASTGTGAIFDVTKTYGVYSAQLCADEQSSAGTGYAVGDTVIISGAQLGGTHTANDLIVTVSTVDDTGSILTFGLTGTARYGDGVDDINVLVTGTDGVDTYIADAVSTDCVVTENDSDLSIKVATNSASELTIYLSNHERVQFADTAFAYDVTGNAGRVYSLLAAGLGLDDVRSEYTGAGLYFADMNLSDKQLAQLLLSTTVYKTDAGGTSDETFVKQVWQNVFDEQATLSDIDWVLNAMRVNHLDQADVLVIASQIDSFQTTLDLVGLQSTGIEYSVYPAV